MDWELAVTARCLREDAGIRGALTSIAPAAIDHGVVRCFVEKRGQKPTGLERIQALRRDIFSLHCGRYRAATWYDKAQDVVWLLAFGIHEEGSARDAYAVFERLHGNDDLLPTAADYEVLLAWRDERFEQALTHEPESLIEKAMASPGHEIRWNVAELVPVAVVYERESDIACLFVAITMELTPNGDFRPPKEWLPLVLAGFYRTTPFDRLIETLHHPDMELPTRGVHPNELLFMDCWDASEG